MNTPLSLLLTKHARRGAWLCFLRARASEKCFNIKNNINRGVKSREKMYFRQLLEMPLSLARTEN
jgi:hypothetical protein